MRKLLAILALCVFLVSCNREVTSKYSTDNGKSVVESYKMTSAEKNAMKRIGENTDQIAIFKVKFGNVDKFKVIKTRVKVYEDGKLIQTISETGMSLTKNDTNKSFYLSFKRQLQLETERTYEWNTTISMGSNNISTIESLYKQPQMTNISTIGSIVKKQEIEKEKEIILGAFVDAVDTMETVEVLPKIQDNETFLSLPAN